MSIHKSKGTGISGRDPCGPRAAVQPHGLPELRARPPGIRPRAGLRGHEALDQIPHGCAARTRASLRREAKAEELRVLYVAMTRAKESSSWSGPRGRGEASCRSLRRDLLPRAARDGGGASAWRTGSCCRFCAVRRLRRCVSWRARTRRRSREAMRRGAWRFHNGYDFAPTERAAEERTEETVPELPLDTAALEWRYPTNRKRRSAPS